MRRERAGSRLEQTPRNPRLGRSGHVDKDRDRSDRRYDPTVRWTRKAAALAAIVGCAATLGASSSFADGDPASDVLFGSDVYLPYPPPSKTTGQALRNAIASAYTRGYRLKVAVIATETDLGAIPSLFGKPTEYARFLGVELSMFYIGPLLIVMPAGYGIYDGGRSTAAEEAVLSKLTVDASTKDSLVASGTKAAQRLVSARALHSKDILPPYLYTQPLTATPGKQTRLLYRVADDSHRSRETIRVQTAAGKTLKVVKTPMHDAYWNRLRGAKWTLAASLVQPGLRFCMASEDAARNASKAFCDRITVEQ